MKCLHSTILLFFALAHAAETFKVQDNEFGRAAVDEEILDMEAALRELYLDQDLSLSMSNSYDYSFSYSYSYDYKVGYDDDDLFSGNGGSTSTGQPVSTPDGASPTPDDVPVGPPTEAPTGISCFGLPSSTFQSPLFVETGLSSLSFNVLEESVTDQMRDILPFCEDPSGSDYYIGTVDLEGDEAASTCEPTIEGNSCFVAELTVRVFGEANATTMEYILDTVESLIKNSDLDEVMASENALIDDINLNSTASDEDNEFESQESKNTGGLSVETKALIISAVIGGAVFIVLVALKLRSSGTGSLLDDEDQDGDEADHMYGP